MAATKTFRITRDCSKAVIVRWDEEVLVPAVDEDAALSAVQEGVNLSWKMVEGSREEDTSSRYPDTQCGPDEGGEYYVEEVVPSL